MTLCEYCELDPCTCLSDIEDEDYAGIEHLYEPETYVWLVERGEDHEGGSVRGVYATEEKAYRAALGMQAAYDFVPDPWVEEEVNSRVSGLPEGSRLWSSRCDWIRITPRPVE